MARIILQTSIFLALTRTAQLLLVPLLVQHPLTHRLMSDGFHHYHLGLGLLIIVLVGYRWIRRYLPTVFALCLAWLVEEHLVILEQLGWQIPHWYLSRRDNIVIYSLAAAGAALGLLGGAWRPSAKEATFDPPRRKSEFVRQKKRTCTTDRATLTCDTGAGHHDANVPASDGGRHDDM